jgi:hypothetical protein
MGLHIIFRREILIWRGDKGTGTSSARKTLLWSVFSEMGPVGPNNREQEKPRTRHYNKGKGNVPAMKTEPKIH